MRITRKLLEKKLEILKRMSKGRLSEATLDYYAIGGGYRIDNANGVTLHNSRMSGKELANALDMVISALHITNDYTHRAD